MTAYLSKAVSLVRKVTTDAESRAKSARDAPNGSQASSVLPHLRLLHFAHRALLGDQRIRLRERPRARDVQDVGVALDVGRERRERRRHLDDLHRRGVEDAAAGTAVDLDVLDAAVALDRHGEQQAAVQLLLARGLRIVEVADALDLEAPVLDIAGEPVLLRARADEAALGPLLVRLHVLGDLRFELHRLERALHQFVRRAAARSAPRRRPASAGPRRSAPIAVASSARASAARAFPRVCVATATCCSGLFFGSTGSGVFARRSASVLPPPSRFACARMSALVGFADGLGVDQRHLERRSLVDQVLEVERREMDHQHDACTSSETPSAVGQELVVARRGAVPRGGIVAGGSAPAGAIRAVRRTGPWRAGGGCGRDRRDDGQRLAGRGSRGFARRGRRGLLPGGATPGGDAARAATAGQRPAVRPEPAPRTGVFGGVARRGKAGVSSRHAAMLGVAILATSVMPMSWHGGRLDRRQKSRQAVPGVAALERRGEEVDASDRHADRGVGRLRRQVGHALHERQPVETDQILADHRRRRLRRRFPAAASAGTSTAPCGPGIPRTGCRSPRNRPAPRRARRRCRRTAAPRRRRPPAAAAG